MIAQSQTPSVKQTSKAVAAMPVPDHVFAASSLPASWVPARAPSGESSPSPPWLGVS
jgi:hypothetical protein